MITGQDFNNIKESVDSMNVLMMTNKIELENEIKELKNKLAENEKVLELHRQTISSILNTLEKLIAK